MGIYVVMVLVQAADPEQHMQTVTINASGRT